jgi:Tetracyclin repressor-like, C-terminal domain
MPLVAPVISTVLPAIRSEILAALVDIVFAQIQLPEPGRDWRPQLRTRAWSARQVLARHRWAIGLLESRADPGPANLRHHDAVIATLRAAGFSPAQTAHAYALIDSYVYGFALQEAALPFHGRDGLGDIAEPIMQRMAAGQYPHLVQMATSYYLQPGYDFGDEFGYGLDLILDGIERSLDSGEAGGPAGG